MHILRPPLGKPWLLTSFFFFFLPWASFSLPVLLKVYFVLASRLDKFKCPIST